jgi:hypothetical protein
MKYLNILLPISILTIIRHRLTIYLKAIPLSIYFVRNWSQICQNDRLMLKYNIDWIEMYYTVVRKVPKSELLHIISCFFFHTQKHSRGKVVLMALADGVGGQLWYRKRIMFVTIRRLINTYTTDEHKRTIKHIIYYISRYYIYIYIYNNNNIIILLCVRE